MSLSLFLDSTSKNATSPSYKPIMLQNNHLPIKAKHADENIFVAGFAPTLPPRGSGRCARVGPRACAQAPLLQTPSCAPLRPSAPLATATHRPEPHATSFFGRADELSEAQREEEATELSQAVLRMIVAEFESHAGGIVMEREGELPRVVVPIVGSMLLDHPEHAKCCGFLQSACGCVVLRRGKTPPS